MQECKIDYPKEFIRCLQVMGLTIDLSKSSPESTRQKLKEAAELSDKRASGLAKEVLKDYEVKLIFLHVEWMDKMFGANMEVRKRIYPAYCV